MRKSAIIALTMLLSLGLIIPVMAAEWSVSGDMRVRSFHKSLAGTDLSDEDATSDGYYDFRIRPVIKIGIAGDKDSEEELYITSRVVIFDETFGNVTKGRYTDDSDSNQSDVAKWDRGWLTWRTRNGQLDAGRMSGGLFGLSLFETESARDRIKWTTKANDNLTLLGIIEKIREGANAGTSTDEDAEAYYIAGIYNNQRDIKAGMLIGAFRNEENLITTSSSIDSAGTMHYYVLDPYCDLKFLDGKLGLKAEIQYKTGDITYKDSSSTDIDIAAMGFYLAASYDFGDFDIELGYANADGDDEATDNEISSLGGLGTVYSGLGDEWTPLVVLQDVNGLLDEGTNSTDTGLSTGVSLVYLIANYDLNRHLNKDIVLSAVFGMANPNAQRVDSGTKVPDSDESFGNEFDLKLAWNITEHIAYKFNFGYLMAGDFFKTTTGDPENIYTIYHALELSF